MAAILHAHSSAAAGYERRRPEQTLLYQTVAKHWQPFVEQADAHGGLPKFVVREVEDYLDCGILERGCVVLGCAACGLSRVVALSCKRRGFCPSCCGRRMNDCVFRSIAITHFGGWRSAISRHRDRPFRASRSVISPIAITRCCWLRRSAEIWRNTRPTAR